MLNRVNAKQVTIVLCALFVTGLISVCLTLAYAQWRQAAPTAQTRPRRVSGERSAPIVVRKGGNLQAAINAAQPGDTLELEAGATFVGTILLPKKAGANNSTYITIQSSRLSELPEGQRVTPADSTKMPKIVAPGFGNPAMQTALYASGYRLLGLEFLTKNPVQNKVPEDSFAYSLLWLGSAEKDQDTLEKVAGNITVDRCYFHSWPDQPLKRGIDLNSASTGITNSYFEGFKVVGQEAQAILGCRGPGPYKIINNYLEGAGENVMFGACDPYIKGLVPSDIEIRRNHFYKPRAWRGKWQVKNLFELKNAQRVVVEGNVFENNWSDAQGGIAILFTVRNQEGSAPWSVVRDVTFTNNVVRHAAGGVSILGSDDIYPSVQSENIRISNNVFEDINTTWTNGGTTSVFAQVKSVRNLTIDHNTVIGDATPVYVVPSQNPGFVFTNNIVKHQNGGIIGEGIGPPDSYTKSLSPFTIKANALVGALEQYWDAGTKYPAGNFFPRRYEDVGFVDYGGGNYRLAANSPFKGKGVGGKDIGADVAALEAASSGVETRAQH
ncbi:MAG: right-handed parallel beta-helix repeat-containing protein [Acidobacteriota bacterium]|nr:right-handed parallel beta-helix repeat-containing protein [Acidobacteriota bacterium]